jgi:hypothetical protein
VVDPSYAILFPDAVDGTLYEFDNGYIQSSELNPGTGYWLRFDGAGSNAVTGQEISNLTLSLNSDWNMISGITDAVDVVNIQDPGGIIIPGTVYGFDNGYAQAGVIEPGNAYWLRTTEDGNVSLNTNGRNDDSAQESLKTQSMEDMTGFILSIIASKPGGNTYHLQFGFTNETNDGDDTGHCSNPDSLYFDFCVEGGHSWFGDQAAPPAPPPPAFDAALKWDLQRWYSQLLDGSPDNAGLPSKS